MIIFERRRGTVEIVLEFAVPSRLVNLNGHNIRKITHKLNWCPLAKHEALKLWKDWFVCKLARWDRVARCKFNYRSWHEHADHRFWVCRSQKDTFRKLNYFREKNLCLLWINSLVSRSGKREIFLNYPRYCWLWLREEMWLCLYLLSATSGRNLSFRLAVLAADYLARKVCCLCWLGKTTSRVTTWFVRIIFPIEFALFW